MNTTVDERFWQKVNKSGPIPIVRPDLGPCWIWTASTDNHGYGQFNNGTTIVKAYAHATTLAGIEVPRGYTRDHLCRVRLCVNPEHIEVVTRGENVRRGEAGQKTGAKNRAKTHCKHGHEFTDDNTYINSNGNRACKTCMRARSSAAYLKRKEAA